MTMIEINLVTQTKEKTFRIGVCDKPVTRLLEEIKGESLGKINGRPFTLRLFDFEKNEIIYGFFYFNIAGIGSASGDFIKDQYEGYLFDVKSSNIHIFDLANTGV